MSKGEDDAEREASAWIARLEAHDVSLRDHQRFRSWLAQAPANRGAYEAVARTWDKLDALAFLDEAIAAKVATPAPSRRLLLLGGIGVGAALVVAGGALLPLSEDANATPYATRIGERKSFALPDGSHAELNADTVMRVSMSPQTRRVHLLQGEALFRVSHEAERPFVVETPFGDLRVRGAAFLVKLGVASARATILEGSLEAARKAGLFARDDVTTASANQELTLDRTSIAQTPLPPQALAHRLAWREGMLAFDGDRLADAALEIERQTGVHVQFADAGLGDMRIGGYISATDVTAFINLVEADLGLHATRRNNTVVISR
jgi:transmembrane sensor